MALPRPGPTQMAAPGLPASPGPRGPRQVSRTHLRLCTHTSGPHKPGAFPWDTHRLNRLARPNHQGRCRSPRACPQALWPPTLPLSSQLVPSPHSLFRLHLKCKKRRKKSLLPCGDSGQDGGSCEGEFWELRVPQPRLSRALPRLAVAFPQHRCTGLPCCTRAFPRRPDGAAPFSCFP